MPRLVPPLARLALAVSAAAVAAACAARAPGPSPHYRVTVRRPGIVAPVEAYRAVLDTLAKRLSRRSDTVFVDRWGLPEALRDTALAARGLRTMDDPAYVCETGALADFGPSSPREGGRWMIQLFEFAGSDAGAHPVEVTVACADGACRVEAARMGDGIYRRDCPPPDSDG
jgi:hypothetical protein